jgi:hypothetical protein
MGGWGDVDGTDAPDIRPTLAIWQAAHVRRIVYTAARS